MKKLISSILILSLALTIIVSAMPSQQTISTKLIDTQMTDIVGGQKLINNNDPGGNGGGWACAGSLLGVGITWIGLGLTGPIGWGVTLTTVGSGITIIANACG